MTQAQRRPTTRLGDRIFRGLTRTSGIAVLALLAAIAVFLIMEALPSLHKDTANFFTEKTWFPDGTPSVFGIAALAFGTILSSALALIISVPVAVGVALFISHYAPRQLAQVLAFIVDLLAAVPSVVYGLWGLFFLMPKMAGLSKFLSDHFGFIPLFHSSGVGFRGSIFVASVILAIMILPIVSALSREVFFQVPRAHEEAALALGATRWEMVRTAVLPFGRPGVISACMLGLGRALGETIAVALVLSPVYRISWHILDPGGNTFAANIALKFGESAQTGRSALIASGLVLFFITLVVNLVARGIIARRREFSGAAA